MCRLRRALFEFGGSRSLPVLMRSCLSLRSASLDSLRISPLPLTRAHCRSITQGTSYFKDSDTVTLGSKCSTVSQDSGIASGIAPFSHSQMIYHDMRVQTSGSTTLNRSYKFGMKTPKSGRGLYLMSHCQMARWRKGIEHQLVDAGSLMRVDDRHAPLEGSKGRKRDA